MKQLILITFLFLSTTISAQDTTKTKEISKFQHHINIGYSYNAWNQLFLFFSQADCLPCIIIDTNKKITTFLHLS